MCCKHFIHFWDDRFHSDYDETGERLNRRPYFIHSTVGSKISLNLFYDSQKFILISDFFEMRISNITKNVEMFEKLS